MAKVKSNGPFIADALYTHCIASRAPVLCISPYSLDKLKAGKVRGLLLLLGAFGF